MKTTYKSMKIVWNLDKISHFLKMSSDGHLTSVLQTEHSAMFPPEMMDILTRRPEKGVYQFFVLFQGIKSL